MAAAAKMNDPDAASAALLDAERNANVRLAEIRASYQVARPRGLGLSRQLQRDWTAYVEELERLEKELFRPFNQEIAQTVGTVANEAKLYIDHRRRLSTLIKQHAEGKRKLVSQEAGDLRHSANDARSAAMKFARDAIRELQEIIAKVEVEFAHKDLHGLSEEDIELLRSSLENKIESVGRKNIETLGKVRDMLTAISGNIHQGLKVTESDILEAIDQELQELREQSEADAELVQLGLAVAIINHEFDAAIRGMRRSLRELRPWASSNKQLAVVYQEIRNSFDHLDGHLNLFTPLQRRLYRKAIPIRGVDIHQYLRTLFEVRLKRHDVRLEVTERFLETEIKGFPSTIYPVFVNILDNAIFWLKDVKNARLISLDAEKGAFLISNNGPVIHKRDYNAIFEQGFTRKPGGRGLGLFISRSALRKEGMEIEVVPKKVSQGVTMKIKWPQ